MTPLTAGEKRLIEGLLDEGMTCPGLAVAVGVNMSTIYKYLRRTYGSTYAAYQAHYGAKVLPLEPPALFYPLPGNDVTAYTRRWIRCHYGSIGRFAEAIGVDAQYVSRRLNTYKIPPSWLSMMGVQHLYVTKENHNARPRN